MNQQVEERIELIDNFIFETGKGESRKWVHYFNGFVTFPFIIVLFLIVEVVSFSAIFNQFSNWAKADMMTFFSLFFILQFPAHFINFLLFKHLGAIKEKQINCSSELNDELKYHLQSITKHFKPYWLKIPVLSLMIIGLTKKMIFIFLDHSIPSIDALWSYLPLPIFAIGILLFGYTNRQILKIRKNLKAVEALI